MIRETQKKGGALSPKAIHEAFNAESEGKLCGNGSGCMKATLELRGRVIKGGRAEGEVLASSQPISFYGGVDPDTGTIREKGHELEGKSIAGKVLVFPHGKGSTVGSYIIYRLKRKGLAPVAIVNQRCEPIVAVGAIISDIPTVDYVDTSKFKSGDWVRIEDGRIVLERR